jgi:hypothetical protein
MLFLLLLGAVAPPAHSQLIPGGPSGDFRVNDRSGSDATTGTTAGPGLPTSPPPFLDKPAVKSPDEVLKSIDKDLGRSTLERSAASPSFNLEKDLRSHSDSLK